MSFSLEVVLAWTHTSLLLFTADKRAYEFCDEKYFLFNNCYTLVGYMFVSTIEATQRGHHQGHNEKYMEVEGPCHVLPCHCSCELNYSSTNKTL